VIAHPVDALVSFVAPASVEADQYRSLRHLVERLHTESAHRVFAVTSPGSGDGKTVTTLNLAGALAQSPDARVLVIDADLHRASVGAYLGLDGHGARGLVDLIRDRNCTLDQTVLPLDGLNLSVLLAGACQGGAYELLSSARLEALLEEARAQFDYIVIDTAPLIPLPDCRVIGRLVDGFLLVVAAHRTPRKMYAEALNLLDSAKVIGTVFNGDDRPLSRYSAYGAYYYSSDAAGKPGGPWWRRAVTSKRSAASNSRNR
jgi:capsular exopolysaccharide synthesis family protein